MSIEYQPLLTYLSVTRLDNSDATLNMERLQLIRDKFSQLYDDKDIDDYHLRHKTIEKIMQDLKITNDRTSFEYFHLAVTQQSTNDAEMEIIDKFRGNAEFLEPIIEDELNKSKEQSTANQLMESKVVKLEEIICIIHQKSNLTEVKDFIKDFLFKQIQPENSSLIDDPKDPLFDNRDHPLPRKTMIDLFIRQQMFERGTITSTRTRTRFRLVEPISLSDEFDSWTFDHFHGLIDFWLTIDLNNKEPFPNQWQLHSQANINYIIRDRLDTTDDVQTSKHLERPSTKSLENFLRDICQIEDNGMFKEWYKGLTENENISTYAHLTNLNQKEWEHIRQLPMNALKIIRFYVDQEKQMIEERKTKKTKDENPEEETSYSRAEIRANLHMIKLYFIRQLENHNGIEAIPRLDAFCVETAFEEMRQEGYEDDGLFDDMKLFFQPLTVTDNELRISPKLLEKLNENENTKKKTLTSQIQISNETLRTENEKFKDFIQQVESFKKQSLENHNKLELDLKEPENKSYQKQIELTQKWSEEEINIQNKIKLQNKTIDEQKKQILDIETEKITCENLLKIIEHNLATQNTKIDRKLVKPHRGFIMYGPPGTGKSVIMSKLAKKIGIAMLGPPLAAGELERPLVGQSEAIILDLCMRGNRLPHLICCVSIDEIDSLAPRRDEDSSEGKVAKISVLLSVIEGIKDVPNLMFFSATNRLHMMDEAFLRRMSGKFFVGRPSSDARKRILDGIPKIILQPSIREKLATATTNFSGAALKALTSAVTVHYLSKRRLDENYEIKEEDTLILADRTARQYQLYFGLETLPRLLLQNLDDLRQLSDDDNSKDHSVGFHLQETCQFTGKILISLADKCVRLETIKKMTERYVVEDQLRQNEQNLQQLLERISSYANDRNVQLLQLIDLNLLSSKGAYDEKKIFETLKERYDECMEYKRSMIVYDLDSLIGVDKSESETSMGTSTSSRVVNQSIYVYVTSRFREAKIEANRSNNQQKIERWAIAVVRDPFLLRKFTADVDFTLTRDQKEQEEEDHRRSSDILICVKCRDIYIESENKMGSCSFHNGFVYDNLSLQLDQYKPSQAIEKLNYEEFLAFQNPSEKEQTDQKKNRFKYICCYATVQVGGGLNGCKKGKHGFGHVKGTTYEKQILKNDMIDKWETACLEDPEYNKRWEDLFTSRSSS